MSKPHATVPPLTTAEARWALWLWFSVRPGFVPVSKFYDQYREYSSNSSMGRQFKCDLRWLVENKHLAKRVDHAKRSPSGRFPDIEYCAMGTGPIVAPRTEPATAGSP